MGVYEDRVLSELYVVYDADGTVIGEVIYSVRKWLGSHCSACDITHGVHHEKPEFTEFKSAFRVPVLNIHRDEMDVRLRICAAGRLPCVVGRLSNGEYVFLVDNATLEKCKGSVELMQREIEAGIARSSISLPEDVNDWQRDDQKVPAEQACAMPMNVRDSSVPYM
mmetsp:Transcript_27/g.65  ORF Transcript_27/g.65 Transcript_27/m.65 type:complete len:166 (-) Transcript_27:321-818(-)